MVICVPRRFFQPRASRELLVGLGAVPFILRPPPLMQRLCGRDSHRLGGGHPVLDEGRLRADEARDRAERGGRSGCVDVAACSGSAG